MKFVNVLGWLLIGSLCLNSCDESDEITEVDFDQTISTSLTVNSTDDSQGLPYQFTETTTIDFTTVQAIQDNIDDIQDAVIDSLSFEIDNYSGTPGVQVTTASILFNNTSIQISDIDLQTSDDNNTIYNIDDPAALAAIEDALQNDDQATVSLNGTLSASPAFFEVIFYLDVTVTASGG